MIFFSSDIVSPASLNSQSRLKILPRRTTSPRRQQESRDSTPRRNSDRHARQRIPRADTCGIHPAALLAHDLETGPTTCNPCSTYKYVSFPLPLTQVSCINFSIKRQNINFGDLIIGLFRHKNQWGIRKILDKARIAFWAYAHKPRQSPSMSLATISAITGSLRVLIPSEKP
jgi:hypothetical protein